jgi:hypothetical protein
LGDIGFGEDTEKKLEARNSKSETISNIKSRKGSKRRAVRREPWASLKVECLWRGTQRLIAGKEEPGNTKSRQHRQWLEPYRVYHDMLSSQVKFQGISMEKEQP